MTWVTDLTHFLDESGTFPPGLPGPARRLAEFLASIVTAATTSRGSSTPLVRCRRRPGHRPCPGLIAHRVLSDSRVYWECPSCGDNGFISNWQGTGWDRSPRRIVH